MLRVNVQGGTNAGHRIIRGPHRRWFCNCEGPDGMTLHPGWRRRCDLCNAERPKPR